MVEVETVNICGHDINYIGRSSFWKAAANGEWEPESFEVLNAYIKPGMLFIDCGAWCGVLSLYAAKLGANVMAFEPDNDSELGLNIEVNDLYDQMFTFPYAIWSENTEMTLHSNGEFGNSKSSLVHHKSSPKTKTVKCVVLKDFIPTYEPICLIKMDIEGAESVVLPSMKDYLTIKPIPIYLSMHPYHFNHFVDDCTRIADTIYPIYNVTNAKTGEPIEQADFIENMMNMNHSLILTPKK